MDFQNLHLTAWNRRLSRKGFQETNSIFSQNIIEQISTTRNNTLSTHLPRLPWVKKLANFNSAGVVASRLICGCTVAENSSVGKPRGCLCFHSCQYCFSKNTKYTFLFEFRLQIRIETVESFWCWMSMHRGVKGDIVTLSTTWCYIYCTKIEALQYFPINSRASQEPLDQYYACTHYFSCSIHSMTSEHLKFKMFWRKFWNIWLFIHTYHSLRVNSKYLK